MVIVIFIANCVISLVNRIYSGAEAQVVTLSPISPIVTQYSPLTFTCATQSTNTKDVIWTKLVGVNPVLAIGTIVIRGDNNCSPPFPSLAPNATLYSYACPATNRLTLTIKNVSRTDNGGTWRCRVTVDGTGINSNEEKITVQVGITDLTLSPATDPVNVIENAQTTLQCRTSGGLPAASVRWFIQRSGQVQDVTSLSTNTYQEEDNLNVTLSTLKFIPLNVDKDGQIYCSANNVGVERNSAKPSINVLYGPSTGKLQNVIKVRGESLVYMCMYTPGNPPTVDFEWTRSGTGVSWVKQNTQNLTIPNVQRSDEASYMCKVSSLLQPTLTSATITQYDTAIFFLDILYGAENLVLQLNNASHASVEVDEHSSNQMRCFLESDPGSNMALTKDGKTIIARSGVHQLTHGIQAECSDTGVYMCSGQNQYGAAENASVHLFVKCSARRPPGVEVQLNFTARQQENATIVYKTVAYPVPKPSQFVWLRCTNHSSCEHLTDEMNKFEIDTEGLTSNLTILDVQIEDYRLYQLSVSNGIGDTLVEWLHLRPIGIPDSPTYLNIIQDSIRETSAVLTWIAGFDNGSPQEFHISYGKVADDTGYITQTVKHDNRLEMNYTVGNLKPGTEYFVSLFSANEEGYSAPVNVTFLTLKHFYDHTETSPNTGPVIGGAVGGTVGAIVAIVVVVIILRRSYALNRNVTLTKKTGDPSEDSISGKDNPGHNAAKTYEVVSRTTDTSVYDDLKTGDSGADNSHVYTSLEESKSKAHVYYENVKKDDPIYNNTVLKNPVQTVL